MRLADVLAAAHAALIDDKRATPGPWTVEQPSKWDEWHATLGCDAGVVADTLNADVVEIHVVDDNNHIDVLGKRNLEFCANARSREPMLARALIDILTATFRVTLGEGA